MVEGTSPAAEAARRNTRKAIVLLTLLTGLLLLAGRLIGGRSGMLLALALALPIDVAACCFAERLALWMADAHTAPEEDWAKLHHFVQQATAALGITRPGVYVIDEAAPNAFAVGRDSSHAAIAVTTGLLQKLEDGEIAAVVGHELMHVVNRDSLVGGTLAVVVFCLTMPLQLMLFLVDVIREKLAGDCSSRDWEDAGAVRRKLMLYLAPLVAPVLQLALARAREYRADAAGASLGDAAALATALEKLERDTLLQPPLDADPAIYHLFFVDPCPDWTLGRLFSVRPPVRERVRRLRQSADLAA